MFFHFAKKSPSTLFCKLGTLLFDSVTVSFLGKSSLSVISLSFLFLFFVFLILIFFHGEMSNFTLFGIEGSSVVECSRIAYSRSRKD